MRVANCVTGSSAVAIYAALFLDPRGRPGPRRRLRWRRPFLARVGVEKLPSNDCIAARTSCCTSSRITVNKLLCLGINASLVGQIHERDCPGKAAPFAGHLQENHAGVQPWQPRVPSDRNTRRRYVRLRGMRGRCRLACACASRGRGRMHSCAPRSGAADDAPLLRRASAGEPAAGTALWTFGRDPRPLRRSPPDPPEARAVLLFWALVVQAVVVATAATNPGSVDRGDVITRTRPSCLSMVARSI